MKRKKVSGLLDNLYLASPCTMSWHSMTGDDRKRLCDGCSKHVYNISDMTRKEAEDFLAENGSSQCMIFYRREDGTILTDDCPVGLRKLRDRVKGAVRVVAGVVALMVSWSPALAQDSSVKGGKGTANKFGVQQADPDGSKKKMLGKVAPNHQPFPGGVALMAQPSNTTSNNTVPKPGVGIVTDVHITSPDPGRSITVHPVGNQSQSNQTFSQHHSSINQASSQNQTIKPNKNLDSKASDYFQKGQSAEKQQKYSLAEFYYQKALDSFDQQKYGDAKFRKLIDNHLRQVQAHLSR